MKLLLAEDTKDLNKAVCTMLSMQGYEVDGVFDGEEALSLAEEKGFDCIILDIMMPKMDGIAVLEKLRSRGDLTPVLLLTAKAEVDDRVNGLEAGADDYLTKPFAMKELLARVKALTRRSMSFGTRELTYADLTLRADSLELSARNTVRLSMKEYECMQLLILNAPEALTASYIIEHIWKDEEAGEATVLLYMNYLKQKLFSIASTAELVGDAAGGFYLTGGKA